VRRRTDHPCRLGVFDRLLVVQDASIDVERDERPGTSLARSER